MQSRFIARSKPTLDQVGNLDVAKLDLDGDNNWNEAGEYNDDRTHNDDPVKLFAYHNAGLDGYGGLSYIDALIVREDDTTGNGTLDRRTYYCQNWRSDVVALVGAGGKLKVRIKYSSYGIPTRPSPHR